MNNGLLLVGVGLAGFGLLALWSDGQRDVTEVEQTELEYIIDYDRKLCFAETARGLTQIDHGNCLGLISASPEHE